MTELDFQSVIIAEAKRLGYLVYHTHDSRRSEPGFPDLVMVAPKFKLVFAIELKTDRPKLKPEQQAWLDRLDNCHVLAECWRPKDRGHAFELLRRFGEAPWQEIAQRHTGHDGLTDRMTAAEYREMVREGKI